MARKNPKPYLILRRTVWTKVAFLLAASDEMLKDNSAIWPADVRIERTRDVVTDVSNVILDNVCVSRPATLNTPHLNLLTGHTCLAD